MSASNLTMFPTVLLIATVFRLALNVSVNGNAYDERNLIGMAYVIEQATHLRDLRLVDTAEREQAQEQRQHADPVGGRLVVTDALAEGERLFPHACSNVTRGW